MSHFIWAQSLAMVLVFPALYFMERQLVEAKRPLLAMGIVMVAALLMAQPSTAAMAFGLFGIWLCVEALMRFTAKQPLGELKWIVIILGGGALLSVLLFWGPMVAIYSLETVLSHNLISTENFTNKTADTSGGVVYGLGDFLDAPFASKMDQPIGWGLAVTILLVLGVVASVMAIRKGALASDIVLLLWLAYGIIGTEGNLLPVKLFPHRFWVVLAIPVSMLAAVGAVWLMDKAGKTGKIAAALIIIGLLLTAASAKYVVETSSWPPGVSWVSNEHLSGYVGLKALPKNTKVFGFCDNENLVNGMDLFGYGWEQEVLDYKNKSVGDSLDGNYAFLKKYGYEYAIIDQTCLVTGSTPEQINGKLNMLVSDSRFMVEQQSNAFMVFRIQ